MKSVLRMAVAVWGMACIAVSCSCGGGSSASGGSPATHLSVSAPAASTAGKPLNFTVTALDASNQVASSYAGTVQFTSSDGQAVFPTNHSTLSNGTGTFSVTLRSTGSQTITATDTANTSLTGASGAIGVSGAATHFSITAPAKATAGTAIVIAVAARDASNGIVYAYSGTVHFTSSDGQAALPSDSQMPNGNLTFPVTLNTVGTQTITATDTASSSITGTSVGISVSGAATHFSLSDPAIVEAGTAFTFTVTALNASNNVAVNYLGTVHFTSSDGQAVLPSDSTLANGTGAFQATMKTMGSQTITATDTVMTSITGKSSPISVLGATHFSVTAPAKASVGSAFDITVTALDAANNVATGYSGTVHFTSTDGHADLPGNSTLANGIATLPVGLKTVGAQTITATDMVSASITGASNSINVRAAAATNPVPFINQPLSPNAAVPGGPSLTLTVNGAGFVTGSKVKWNGSERATTFVSATKLTATILSTDLASFNTAWVTVVNPTPGGGISNVVFFGTTRSTASVAISTVSQLAVGSSVVSVAAGDFNGDGKLDLAAANGGSNNVSVLLGRGDGTFQPAVNYAAGSAPSTVAVGDFNGDGKVDLVVTNAGSNSVSVLLGKGDGTFQTAANFGVGAEPVSVVVADFNLDGNLDLAVANVASGNLSVLLGNGDGTFQTALNYSATAQPLSIAAGDFDGDGILDLAVVNFGSGVNVLLGNGDGTFQTPVSYAAGSVPVAVAVGDFNGDGIPDLAVANIGLANTGPGNVDVLLGNGRGTFLPAVEYPGGTNVASASLAVGDFNGDGILDLAVANTSNDTKGSGINLLLGKSDGTFQPAVDYAVGSNPYAVAIGAFNNNGRLDLATPAPANSTVSVLLQPSLVSGPDAVFSPNSLTFATQLVGTTSSAESVLLTNYGTAALSITNIAASSNFGETETCGSSLPPGESCPIDVTFTPTAEGPLSGTLSVADNAPGSPQTAILNGTGTVVTLTPTTMRFFCSIVIGYHGQPHCMCSRPGTATLTNTGSTALIISDIAITGPFSETNTCDGSVAAGQSCSIGVTWNHATGGGILSFSDNGGGSPQTVSLSGIAQCKP
jgi:hypothetical protein